MIAPCANCGRTRTRFDRIADHCAACWTSTPAAKDMRALLRDVREYMTGTLTGSAARVTELALLERIDRSLKGD